MTWPRWKHNLAAAKVPTGLEFPFIAALRVWHVNEPGCHTFEGKHMLAVSRDFLERLLSFVYATPRWL